MTARTEQLCREIQPFLAGEGAEVQGAVLADLVAMWLAGHVVLDDNRKIDGDATDAARTAALDQWLDLVRALSPINEKTIEAKIGAK
jgi:hypothetical protein